MANKSKRHPGIDPRDIDLGQRTKAKVYIGETLPNGDIAFEEVCSIEDRWWYLMRVKAKARNLSVALILNEAIYNRMMANDFGWGVGVESDIPLPAKRCKLARAWAAFWQVLKEPEA